MRKNNGTLRRALKYIGRYRFLLPLSILFGTVAVAMTLYLPLVIGDAIDLIVGEGHGNMDEITVLLVRCAVIIGITALSQWIMSTINNRIAFSVVKDIRNDAFRKIERLPLSYIDTNPTGDTVNRVINDAEQFSEGLLLGFSQLLSGVLTIIGTLGFMIYINPLIALLVAVLTPLSLFIAKFIASKTFNMFKSRRECEARQTSFIGEIVGNQRVVKSQGAEADAIASFGELNSALSDSSLKAIFFSSLTNPCTRFVNSLVYAAVALAGALTVIGAFGASGGAALLTVGELSCLLSYANQYTKPFNEISGVVTEFQNALASVGRILELIDEPSEPRDSEDALAPTECKGEVGMESVDFSYTPARPLIQGLSIEAEAGQRIAIVGPTGCGKTTLINLLMRFYDVTGGRITVDGVDIRNMKRESLREKYGMVLQDTWIKSGTVRENIAIGKQDATDEEIIAAARASHSHGFIKRLKNGYDTLIGEGGEELSQGQKQLICITRIMLALPPMLILDEATSSIDTRTEMKIQEAFTRLMEGRTSFIVAHRLSTVRDADLILVMRDGNIIEKGRHEELLARGGFYYTLYNSQFAHC